MPTENNGIKFKFRLELGEGGRVSLIYWNADNNADYSCVLFFIDPETRKLHRCYNARLPGAPWEFDASGRIIFGGERA